MDKISSGPHVFGRIENPAVVAKNNFIFKSLSDFSYNIALGCKHGCTFCYVPNTSAIKQEVNLEKTGLIPEQWIEERKNGNHWGDFHWGEYALLRTWDEKAFRRSLIAANKATNLTPDGHRAIMLCTTTDPYQTFSGANARALNEQRRVLIRKGLEMILEESDLKVRILTRSPLAKEDFDLYKRFGNRLLFGMSIPTLDDKLSQIYEPNAPGPKVKLETLKLAVGEGIPIYVALAPTLPDEGEMELQGAIKQIAALKPVTIFHEPINLRAENLARIEAKAASLGKTIRSEVFSSPERWREYAFMQFALVEKIFADLKLPEGLLHQWPDKALASKAGFLKMKQMQYYRDHNTSRLTETLKAWAEQEWEDEKLPWLQYWQNPTQRISAWPTMKHIEKHEN